MHQWFGSFMIRGLCAKTALAPRKDELGGVTTKVRGRLGPGRT
jgi:hypothetical protein